MLFALGIRYVGKSTAKEIAQHFGDIDKIAAASMDELLAVPDVGEVIAKSVYDFFRVPPASRSGITAFLLAGRKPGPEKRKPADDLKIPVVSEDEFRKMLPEGSMPEDEVTEPDLFGGMVDD